MQTFLPYADFAASAKVLDRRRLGKQRVECKQIINALTGQSKGWANHPASKMWDGHVHALAQYGYAVCTEWRSRGYKDSLLDYFANVMATATPTGLPYWVGNAAFHRSHQSNLLRKDPVHYSQFFVDVPHDLPYIWP